MRFIAETCFQCNGTGMERNYPFRDGQVTAAYRFMYSRCTRCGGSGFVAIDPDSTGGVMGYGLDRATCTPLQLRCL